MTTSSATTPCRHCEGYHVGVCPRIRAIHYDDMGRFVTKVEYFSPEELNPLIRVMRRHRWKKGEQFAGLDTFSCDDCKHEVTANKGGHPEAKGPLTCPGPWREE